MSLAPRAGRRAKRDPGSSSRAASLATRGPGPGIVRPALDQTAIELPSLLLSPVGGWLDVSGEWETQQDTPLGKWHHVASAGQDQRVVVQRGGGFPFPFGHRAALVKVTERRWSGSKGAPSPACDSATSSS